MAIDRLLDVGTIEFTRDIQYSDVRKLLRYLCAQHGYDQIDLDTQVRKEFQDPSLGIAEEVVSAEMRGTIRSSNHTTPFKLIQCKDKVSFGALQLYGSWSASGAPYSSLDDHRMVEQLQSIVQQYFKR